MRLTLRDPDKPVFALSRPLQEENYDWKLTAGSFRRTSTGWKRSGPPIITVAFRKSFNVGVYYQCCCAQLFRKELLISVSEHCLLCRRDLTPARSVFINSSFRPREFIISSSGSSVSNFFSPKGSISRRGLLPASICYRIFPLPGIYLNS